MKIILLLLSSSCYLTAVVSLRNLQFDDFQENENVEVIFPEIFAGRSSSYSYVKSEEANCKNRLLTNKHVAQVKMLEKAAKCIPRDTAVDLIAPVGEILAPATVIVKRCGGSCRLPMNCVPSKQTELKIPVRKMKNKTTTTCSLVTVMEHTECTCGCHKTKSSCTERQNYVKSKCDCVCNNPEEQQQCLNHWNNNMIWDNKTCSCVCSEKENCTTGSYWIKEMCKCMKMR